MPKIYKILFAVFLLLVSGVPFYIKVSAKEEFVAGEVIVKFRDDSFLDIPFNNIKESNKSKNLLSRDILSSDIATASDSKFNSLKAVNSKYKLKKLSPLYKNSGVLKESVPRLLKVDVNSSVEKVIDDLKKDPNIEYVEKNFIVPIRSNVPNDGEFSIQWALHNTGQIVNSSGLRGIEDFDIDWLEFYNSGLKPNPVLVCVPDSSFKLDDADMVGVYEKNLADVVDGVDNDGNGFVDDYDGWNFFHNTNTIYYYDNNVEHGNHIAKIIGSITDNTYRNSGINPTVKILPVQIGKEDGGYPKSSIVPALRYCADRGAKIVNLSFGCPTGCFSQSEKDAHRYIRSKGVLAVTSAGNESVDINNLEVYPEGYGYDNLISTAALENSGNLADFSNFGNSKVHISAPGKYLISNESFGNRVLIEGTSYASPHVVGVASIIWGLFPNSTYKTVKASILNNADVYPSLVGKISGGRSLNLYNTIKSLVPSPAPTPSSSINGFVDIDKNNVLDFSDLLQLVKIIVGV